MIAVRPMVASQDDLRDSLFVKAKTAMDRALQRGNDLLEAYREYGEQYAKLRPRFNNPRLFHQAIVEHGLDQGPFCTSHFRSHCAWIAENWAEISTFALSAKVTNPNYLRRAWNTKHRPAPAEDNPTCPKPKPILPRSCTAAIRRTSRDDSDEFIRVVAKVARDIAFQLPTAAARERFARALSEIARSLRGLSTTNTRMLKNEN